MGRLSFCKSHNTEDGNLLLISPVTARRARVRAEEMFSSCCASAAGGTDASRLSLANGGIVFLLASTLSFRKGLNRNTCWTEKTAEGGKGLYYHRVAQELMEMTVGMVTKWQRMVPICYLILVLQRRGEEEELVLPLIQGRHLCCWDPEWQFTPTSFLSSGAWKHH